MDWFIVIVAALLLLLGTPIALAWWKLARKAAPYRDEPNKPGRGKGAEDGAEVIVLPTSSNGKQSR